MLLAIWNYIIGIVRLGVFILGITLIMLVGVVYHTIYGGPITTPDMWFLIKILLCVPGPFVLAFLLTVGRKGSVGKAWTQQLVIVVLSFIIIVGLIRHGAITFDINTPAPSFRAAQPDPRSYTVNADGKAEMTCAGLLDLRNSTLRGTGSRASLAIIDERMKTCTVKEETVWDILTNVTN